MQKTYCEICKQEIKVPGNRLADSPENKIAFMLEARTKTEHEQDVCLACVIKAVNKEANLKLKRRYIRKSAAKETPES